MSRENFNPLKAHDLARVKIRALLIVVIFALAGLIAVYYIAIRDSAVGPPSPDKILSPEEKLEILDELSQTNPSPLTLDERRQILDQLVEDSPKRNQ